VADTLDRRNVFTDPRFQKHRDSYLNILIKQSKEGWEYDETDRALEARHGDWLWRIAAHDCKKADFESHHQKIYESGHFNDGDVNRARNYVVFSTKKDEIYIAPEPPKVATAIPERREHEVWTDDELQRLTVGEAGNNLASGRDYLRVANRSGRNVHRQLRFNLPSEEASRWRHSLVSELRKRIERG
jgi:hypothetical protein